MPRYEPPADVQDIDLTPRPSVLKAYDHTDRIATHIDARSDFRGNIASDDQFRELMAFLKEMLTPGYELAKMYFVEARRTAQEFIPVLR